MLLRLFEHSLDSNVGPNPNLKEREKKKERMTGRFTMQRRARIKPSSSSPTSRAIAENSDAGRYFFLNMSRSVVDSYLDGGRKRGAT